MCLIREYILKNGKNLFSMYYGALWSPGENVTLGEAVIFTSSFLRLS